MLNIVNDRSILFIYHKQQKTPHPSDKAKSKRKKEIKTKTKTLLNVLDLLFLQTF